MTIKNDEKLINNLGPGQLIICCLLKTLLHISCDDGSSIVQVFRKTICTCPVFLTNLEGKVGKVGKVGKEGRLRE